MNVFNRALNRLNLSSDGEEVDDGSRDAVGGAAARTIPAEEDTDDLSADDFGFYDADDRFYIRLARRIPVPRHSNTIPGAMDVYSPEEFRLDPGRSRDVNLGFGLAVPRHHLVEFSSRPSLLGSTGVVCLQSIVGAGLSRDELSVRLFNSSRFPWNVRVGDAIALMFTMRAHYAHIEFHHEGPESERD